MIKLNLPRLFAVFSVLIFAACTSMNTRTPGSEGGSAPELILYTPLNVKLRAGYLLEQAPLKACVLYLEGLADSMLNHKPYFSALSLAGYRVIAFDYMGQGGSKGSMNDTRVKIELPPDASPEMLRRYNQREKYFAIPEQAEFVWKHYASVKNAAGHDCLQSKKFVIGWSTGGLAAYRMAHEKRADAVVLIAPGIHPKMMVGESAERWDKLLTFRQVITEQTLTRNKFAAETNPHIDPISPISPMRVPQFAGNLLGTSISSRDWKIDSNIAGVVFLSGLEDTYVDRDKTIQTLSQNAPHFNVFSYDGALHELDNELPEVSAEVHLRTVQFFDSLVEQK